ncbi:MAG: hypothetical protein HY725_15765 [Candidatus Rokubacteria bacterium]|nr:hypothetical protein [Candidatus Rokubacteria bacterium]
MIRSRAETRRYVEQELNRKYPAARVEAERKALVAWGLIPTGFDLRGFLVDLLEEQAAAYYDPVGKVMVLADWLTAEQQQAALLHELVHALQDRDVVLDQFLTAAPGKGDQALARQALVEGEAIVLSLELLLKAQGLDLRQIPDLSTVRQLVAAQSVGPVIDKAPKFLKDLLLFPYVQGLIFFHQLRLAHPQSVVSQLYRDPPRSTSQILHPVKLVGRREDPLPVSLPDLRPILPPAWRRVIEDELGEWALGAVLERHLGEQEARRLASGWRGDRYQVWEDSGGQALVYRVSWEKAETAEAFAQAYGGLLEKRHPALAGKAVKGAGVLWSWQDGPQGFLVERQGLDVLVFEGVPASAVEPLRQALWRVSPLAPTPVR